MTDQHINGNPPTPFQKPIDELLHGQLARLGITKSELVKRWGSTNVAKNMRIERATTRAFEPHGFLLGSESRPSQIVIYGVTGAANRWLRIELDLSSPLITYSRQALAVARRTPLVPFHGKTTGFVINYTPDHAVRFDIDGNPVAVLASAYVPGHTEVTIGSWMRHGPPNDKVR